MTTGQWRWSVFGLIWVAKTNNASYTRAINSLSVVVITCSLSNGLNVVSVLAMHDTKYSKLRYEQSTIPANNIKPSCCLLRKKFWRCSNSIHIHLLFSLSMCVSDGVCLNCSRIRTCLRRSNRPNLKTHFLMSFQHRQMEGSHLTQSFLIKNRFNNV